MITNGEKVFDRAEGLGIGQVIGVAGDTAEPKLTVRFQVDGHDIDLPRDLASVARRGEIYVDARGAEMAAMSYSSALELVWTLGESNQPAGTDIDRNEDALAAKVDWQQRALDTLHDLVTNHHETIDETFTVELHAQPEVGGLMKIADDADPEDILNAIKISFDLAREATLDPKEASRDVSLADEHDRQNQAFDIVYDLVSLHGGELKDRITAIPSAGP